MWTKFIRLNIGQQRGPTNTLINEGGGGGIVTVTESFCRIRSMDLVTQFVLDILHN
jgi:hypothetical protein